VQKLKYAEELVGALYIKPHTIIANKDCALTLGASAPDPIHRRGVAPRPGGDKIGKIEAYCLSGDKGTAGQGPQTAEDDVFSIKTNEDRPSGTFARGAASIG
jgi:hypothetical protein